MPKISIVKGEDRKENISKAIKLIWKDIEKAIKNKKSNKLFIKINAIDVKLPLACTHIDALESVLDIFYSKFDEVIVGDNSFAFEKENGIYYRKILEKFPKIKFSDLTEFETEEINFERLDGNIIKGRVSLLPKKAFTISLALPKTHDTFVYTGCLKNMLGCVIKNRSSVHALKHYERLIINKYVKSNKLKWANLVGMINETKPDLCILDGYEGMEGDGPLLGDRVELKIALCSLDGLSLDILASKICGTGYVPYLSILSKNKNPKIEIIKHGFNDIKEISKKFKPHYLNKYQLMTDKLLMPIIDIRAFISLMKRSYRIRDKIIDKIKEKFSS